jgi:integrase
VSRQVVSEHRRSRVLTDDELRAVWIAAKATEGPFGALVRLALLTSARRGEIAGMRWDEVDAESVWALPASRSKTKTDIVRPLSKAALAIIDTRPRIDGCPYIFTANGVTAMRAFSRQKAALDAASGVTGWRLHDCRRTARSLLSRAGVNVDVAERCLGHTMAVIRGTYDRHKYVDEMSHAFEALAAEIKRIVDPPTGDVIPLRGRGA